MPPPGDIGPARIEKHLSDLIWDGIYAPIADIVWRLSLDPECAAVFDHPPLSRLRVRRTGDSPAGACTVAVIQDLLVQGTQMALVLLLAPLLTGLVRKVKARLQRRRGPSLIQPYRDLQSVARQGSGAIGKRLLAVSRRAICDLCRHLGRGGFGAHICHGPAVQLVGRPDRDHRTAGQRAVRSGAGRNGHRYQFRRHRFIARSDDCVAG